MGKYEYKYGGKEAEQNVTPRICSPTGRGVSDTQAPPNTEEDEIIICPWMDCLLKGKSDDSSASGKRKYNMDYPYNKNVNFNSDRDPTSVDSSWEDYEECSDYLEIKLEEGAPAFPLEIQILVTGPIFQRRKRSHRWNNSPVVESPVVNERVVSNTWNGSLMT